MPFIRTNQNLGGNILSYNESEDAYYIQYGADSVPKKLGSNPEVGGFVTTLVSGGSTTGTIYYSNSYDTTPTINSTLMAQFVKNASLVISDVTNVSFRYTLTNMDRYAQGVGFYWYIT